jgi:molecular chaperone GrpE
VLPGGLDRHRTQDAELEDRLLRALSDLDNLRKRFDRELERERQAQRDRIMLEWLPVVDDLERALEHAPADDPIGDGVRAVRDRALDVLSRLGYPRFDDVGHPFDPRRDEAVSTVDADAPPGTVVAALRPGYGAGQMILRPASVVVARKPA